MRKYLTHVIGVLFVLQGCNLKSDSSLNLRPRAKGSIGEIILVMDTTKWKGPLGEEIREIFDELTPGLPRKEKLYDLHYVSPDRLNNVLKGASNMIFIATQDGTRRMKNFFTQSFWDKIEEDPNFFMNTAQNEFARDQEILQLFGPNEEVLLANIQANRQIISSYFNEIEKKRLVKKYETNRSEKGLEKSIANTFGLEMHVPKGFRTAISEPDFIWIRDAQYDIDQNIFITYQPYTSESMFEKDSIIKWRNRIARKYLYGDPEDTMTFVKTEQEFAPIHYRKVSFNDQFGVEIRALWKTNKIIGMGGPFISYTFLDQNTNRIYYIEAFLYSPGVDQRNIMKQLEAVLWTFKTPNGES
jgi:hypothetical protein